MSDGAWQIGGDMGNELPNYAAAGGAFRREFVEDTRLQARDALAAIVAAYDAALADPQAKMPTTLHAAIENARRVL